MIIYKFNTVSPSDPRGDKGALGFNTREEAKRHVKSMNELLTEYDSEDSLWNKQFWKSKPQEWVLKDNSL